MLLSPADLVEDTQDKKKNRLATWRLIYLGITGGMVPCPAGVVVLLASLGMGALIPGFFVLLAFSLGLGLVLTTIALIMILARGLVEKDAVPGKKRLFQRLPLLRNRVGACIDRAVFAVVPALPLLSAAGIAVVGGAIVMSALSSLSLR